MKKISVLLLTIVSLFLASAGSLAAIRTVYPTGEPISIRTKLDNHVYIVFKSSIITASIGNRDLFDASTDNLENKVKITPKRYGASTNLIVFTSDGGQYEFWVEDVGDGINHDGIVNVETSPDIQIADVISLVNKRKISIDPAIKNLINFYEITEPTYATYQNLTFHLKRAATISNLNKAVYWLRVENTSDNILTLPDVKKDQKAIAANEYCIPLNTFFAKDRIVSWVAVEANKEKLAPGEFTDLYLVVHGNFIDASLGLTFNCNNKNVDISIKNIPYSKQDFRVFVAEDNNYTSVSIEDYWR